MIFSKDYQTSLCQPVKFNLMCQKVTLHKINVKEIVKILTYYLTFEFDAVAFIIWLVVAIKFRFVKLLCSNLHETFLLIARTFFSTRNFIFITTKGIKHSNNNKHLHNIDTLHILTFMLN